MANVATSTKSDDAAYYDPYDFKIDEDPYPIWKRLRDEHPLYYNDRYDFFALSRFDDVESCSKDWRRYSSAKGTLLELIKSGVNIPPGSIIFEDPPYHDVHRALVTGIFSPRKIAALEPQVRAYCARGLDARVGTGGFDFVADLGAKVSMRTIGLLLGIPETDQESIRDRIDDGLRLETSAPLPKDMHARLVEGQAGVFAEYVDWRVKSPGDDIISHLIQTEFEDVDGQKRRLRRDEVVGFVNLIAAAGSETTTRLIGWTGKVLAEHPEQRRALVNDLSLVPRAIEEVLRYESPSPVQARYVTEDVEHHGQRVPAGSSILLLTASANRDERNFPNADQFDIRRQPGQHLAFGYGLHFCLGAALARLEGRIALEEVLRRFPEWEVDREHAVQAHTSTVRGWRALPVKTR